MITEIASNISRVCEVSAKRNQFGDKLGIRGIETGGEASMRGNYKVQSARIIQHIGSERYTTLFNRGSRGAP